MTRQWLRECKLEIEGAGTVDVSDLRIRFKIEQTNIQRPNSATITVTNLSKPTAQRIKDKGKKVRLEAGYQGSAGLIFAGEIIQTRIGRETPVDTYLTMIATSGDQAYNFGVVNKTLAAGHTHRDQVDAVLEAFKPYGIKPGFISDLGSIKMPRARSLFGLGRDILRSVAFATNSSWSIQDDKLQVLKNTDTSPGGPFVLNSRTGMVGMPIQTMDGILVRCLLNHRIRPGVRIHINQSSIQQSAFSPNYGAEVNNSMLPSISEDGFYKCVIVEHEGDTRGLPWYTDINCIRADGQGPIPVSYAAQGIVDPDTNAKY